MDKFGVIPEELACEVCGGNKRLMEGCTACNGTGRKTGKVDPEKEAELLRQEREESHDG